MPLNPQIAMITENCSGYITLRPHTALGGGIATGLSDNSFWRGCFIVVRMRADLVPGYSCRGVGK